MNKDQPDAQEDDKNVVNSYNSSNNNSNSPNRCLLSNHLSNRIEGKKILSNKLLLYRKNLKKSKFKSIRKLIELLKMNKLFLKDKTPILSQTDLIEGFALKGFSVRYQISKFWGSFEQTKGTSMFLLWKILTMSFADWF